MSIETFPIFLVEVRLVFVVCLSTVKSVYAFKSHKFSQTRASQQALIWIVLRDARQLPCRRVTMPHDLISFSFFLVCIFSRLWLPCQIEHLYISNAFRVFRNKLSVLSVFLWIYTGRHVAECTQRSSTSTSLLLCTIYINDNLLIQ